MNSFIVFLGPTCRHDTAREILPADYRPPAAMGDLYRAAHEKPPGLVLIDGEFGNKPSVMHQEILWCMAQGIPVLGAASMGALRAAELDRFGMIGFGVIYNSYASGQLTDDDEVAVAHAPMELGWQPVSIAMVDLRFALSNAIDEGVTTIETARRVIALAKQMHFGARTVEHILDAALSQFGGQAANARLREWLKKHPASLKHRDAVLLLESLARQAPLPPVKAQHSVCTVSWVRAMRELDARAQGGSHG